MGVNRKYSITEVSPAVYEIYVHGALLASVSRNTFRTTLEGHGLGTHAIGMILRVLNKKYPPPVRPSAESEMSRLLCCVGEHGLADYLRSKGLRVFKRLRVSDREIVEELENRGYEIDGLLDGVYYSTLEKPCGSAHPSLNRMESPCDLRVDDRKYEKDETKRLFPVDCHITEFEQKQSPQGAARTKEAGANDVSHARPRGAYQPYRGTTPAPSAAVLERSGDHR